MSKSKLEHLRDVLLTVDRSTFGSAEDIAKRDELVEESMRPYRLRAMENRYSEDTSSL